MVRYYIDNWLREERVVNLVWTETNVLVLKYYATPQRGRQRYLKFKLNNIWRVD